MQPRKQCNHAGCRILIPYTDTYCTKHQPMHKRKQSKYDTYQNRKTIGGKYFKFYHSKAWRKASELYRINNPCCEDCLEENTIRKVDVVDHVIELRDDWSKRLDTKNFRSRCHYHHNLKTRLARQKRDTQEF